MAAEGNFLSGKKERKREREREREKEKEIEKERGKVRLGHLTLPYGTR